MTYWALTRIHTDTRTERGRQADRNTVIQTDRQTDIYTQTGRHENNTV